MRQLATLSIGIIATLGLGGCSEPEVVRGIVEDVYFKEETAMNGAEWAASIKLEDNTIRTIRADNEPQLAVMVRPGDCVVAELAGGGNGNIGNSRHLQVTRGEPCW